MPSGRVKSESYFGASMYMHFLVESDFICPFLVLFCFHVT